MTTPGKTNPGQGFTKARLRAFRVTVSVPLLLEKRGSLYFRSLIQAAVSGYMPEKQYLAGSRYSLIVRSLRESGASVRQMLPVSVMSTVSE